MHLKCLKILAFTILLVWFLYSCGKERIYDQSISIQDQSWQQDSILRFIVTIDDTIILHKFYLNIRHNTDYSYSNIYFFFNSTLPNGNKTRDTIECILANPMGKWLGKGFGKIRDNRILLNSGLRFPMKGIYLFEIGQAMRTERLKGVEDIGIRIEKE
jgi:gliding motility-associated lipoprotein GldH